MAFQVFSQPFVLSANFHDGVSNRGLQALLKMWHFQAVVANYPWDDSNERDGMQVVAALDLLAN